MTPSAIESLRQYDAAHPGELQAAYLRTGEPSLATDDKFAKVIMQESLFGRPLFMAIITPSVLKHWRHEIGLVQGVKEPADAPPGNVLAIVRDCVDIMQNIDTQLSDICEFLKRK